MSKKQTTVWKAPDHTIAKIEILRSYLFVWFSILGRTFSGRPLWYIDGFSGPGEYTNFAYGSPVAALKAAHAALSQSSTWRAGDIHCLFVEDDTARFRHLKSLLEKVEVDKRIHWTVYPGEFTAGLAELKTRPESPLRTGAPVFTFIDPFGAKGLSFRTIADLLSRPTCEVLLNLDSDGIARIYSAGEHANHRELLNEVFGDDSWEAEFERMGCDVPRAIVAMYKRRLRALPGVDYVFAFEMRTGKTSINYHLVFASQHPLGLEKMKEEMKRLDQDGTYSFSSSNVGQQQLFDFDNPDAAADELFRQFRGRSATYGELKGYALNESPFTNPKSMLKMLERAGRITVSCSHGDRRRGTYPELLESELIVHFGERG